jgi:glycosyltransferase involved in cell wall biosynthesis
VHSGADQPGWLAQRAEVHVFALQYPARRDTYCMRAATVHALGIPPVRPLVQVPFWSRAIQTIRAEHRRSRFDVLHAFWATGPGWVTVTAGRLLDVPTIVSVTGGELVAMPDIDYGAQLGHLSPRLVPWALRHADRVTVGAAYTAHLCRQLVPGVEPVWAPLGVDTEMFRPGGPHPPRHRRRGNPPWSPGGEGGGLRLLNVASLLPVKDQVTLLHTVQRALAAGFDVRLDVVGDGPLAANLHRLAVDLDITDRVVFRTSLPHPTLSAVYAAADLFVLSSRHEAQGMVVLEAAACGVPTVGTAVGVVPPAYPVALANAIIELAADPTRRQVMGWAARARVEGDYSLSAAGERFLRMYAEFV